MFYYSFVGLVLGVATAYQLSCPDKSQWHFLQTNCATSTYYTCLFNYISKKYEAECSSREYLAKDGSKKIRMPGVTDGNCNKERYQPTTFNASQSSVCSYLKSGCEEEGQVLVSHGAPNQDRTCRCDYRAGYTYVIPPRNNCACIPSVDDCSCRKIYCKQNEGLSQDYKCERKTKLLLTVCNSISDITTATGEDIALDPSLQSNTPSNVSGKIVFATIALSLIAMIVVFVGIFWLKVETNDRSNKSDVPSRPENPFCDNQTYSSITLSWDEPTRGSNQVDHYEIKYKECKTGGKWVSLTTKGNEKIAKIKHLRSMTDYEFKIRATNKDGEEGPFSELIKSYTVQALARAVLKDAQKVVSGEPSLYKLPLKQNVSSTNNVAKTRKCTLEMHAAQHNEPRNEKTIMLVGATGAGKSTLIDGMINYIFGVSWEDDFRFTLVDLADKEISRIKKEAESQTEWITCYSINQVDGSNIGYDLNIIDTPGFGDTRGIARDKAIVDQIKELFTTPGDQGISCLDAVCFVTQAPLGNLTPHQKYIFDLVLSLFGQDIKNNIFILITFADNNLPPVCDALQKAAFPFRKYFKFNNSALFAQPSKVGEAEFCSFYWKICHDSYDMFFNELDNVNPISLQLTRQVLKLRKVLETAGKELQSKVTEGINKLNIIKQEQEVLERLKKDIELNRDFSYEVEEIQMRKIELEPGKYAMNCMICNRTCHYSCTSLQHDIKNCSAIRNGFCTACPQRCHWKSHVSTRFRFEMYPVKVKKTISDLKGKYDNAIMEEQSQKSFLSNAISAFESLGNDAMKIVQDLRGYINELNEIVLMPNPLSNVEYIDVLIESERYEKRDRWETRVKLYQEMRKEAELLARITEVNYSPWDDEDIIKDM